MSGLEGVDDLVATLDVLAVDDEAPALDEVCYLLGHCPAVRSVGAASSATDALRLLHQERFDAVLLDVRMPGLDGIELARVLSQFGEAPSVVFVTAHEEYAMDAFELDAAGYLLKPVDPERLRTVLSRVAAGRARPVAMSEEGVDPLEQIGAELPGRTTMVGRDEVVWVESAGDYVRLHLRAGGSHLVRIPMAMLEERWSVHGFARIHRRSLVSLRDVRELRSTGSQTVALVGDEELAVSRRHLRELRRDRLVRNGTQPWR